MHIRDINSNQRFKIYTQHRHQIHYIEYSSFKQYDNVRFENGNNIIHQNVSSLNNTTDTVYFEIAV